MFRTLCLILLTTFLICKATGVAGLLLAKQKASVTCESGTCDNENEETEVEKIGDDQLLTSHSLDFGKCCLAIPLKNAFSFTNQFQSETFYKLLSPPPELI
ncbi:hypothetical protein [Dyadobacter luticola]|uniref:Uncharacterized protein n=1 Tax=Dyadobacter luticola TaxID=1979387 RepID=A0A5R9KSH1_9BACT|nr:hypothetical protein [Dyadobacter luticola]TLU99036.1 hypothetical protein FEN17_20870 [Dyadobacter luticola]